MNKIKEIIESVQLPVLHLNLEKKWFDMVLSGQKLEEYRKNSIFWSKVFVKGDDGIIRVKIAGKYYLRHEVAIVFSNGYSPNRRQMLMHISGISTYQGLLEWGAPIGSSYFNIRLGEIIATHNCTVPMVTIEKITELENATHPENIAVGFTLSGRMAAEPKLFTRFRVGPTWSTSVVTEIIDENTFKTLNSIYRIKRY